MPEPQKPRKKVVLSLIEKDGSFLLIRRKHRQLKLEWAFPGGIVKPGETDEEAVVRETREEVMLDVEVVQELLERQHPETLVLLKYFHCRLLSDQEGQIGEDYEIAQIQWVRAKEVLDQFTSDVHPVIREFILSFSGRGENEISNKPNERQ